jgi:hypothetical protein
MVLENIYLIHLVEKKNKKNIQDASIMLLKFNL